MPCEPLNGSPAARPSAGSGHETEVNRTHESAGQFLRSGSIGGDGRIDRRWDC
jgi:hypothetical protein